jgi:hypothetical protein
MAIDYDLHKAKPIIIGGVLFRSRLEATIDFKENRFYD